MPQPKKKVQFLEDVSVVVMGEVDFSAKAGEVKELSYASANRWLRRNKATTEIQGSTKAVKKAAPKKKASKKKDAKTSETKSDK